MRKSRLVEEVYVFHPAKVNPEILMGLTRFVLPPLQVKPSKRKSKAVGKDCSIGHAYFARWCKKMTQWIAKDKESKGKPEHKN
jgi:hypothetical protein